LAGIALQGFHVFQTVVVWLHLREIRNPQALSIYVCLSRSISATTSMPSSDRAHSGRPTNNSSDPTNGGDRPDDLALGQGS